MAQGGANYQLTGTQFNGLSQAVAYGDDYQGATNYPLVRIKNDGTGHVFYARTHSHSTMAVATGSMTVSTEFDVPASIELGASTLVVVANGIASQPVSVNVGSASPPTPTATPTPIMSSANLSLSTKALKFPNEPFGISGKTSPPMIVTLSNPGGAKGSAVVLKDIVAQPPSNYALTAAGVNQCVASQILAPGGKCEIAITFTPTGFDSMPGTLTVMDNAHNSPQMVTLTGTGIRAVLAIAPKTLPAGSQPSGTSSASKQVTLTNNSGVALSIMSITSTDTEFALDTSACANKTLANGALCSIGVIFTPTSKGASMPRCRSMTMRPPVHRRSR